MKNPTIPYEQFSTERLLDILINHDCTLSPEDGCDCTFINELLDKRSKEIKPLILKIC